jgi:RecJ-like exonuclease
MRACGRKIRCQVMEYIHMQMEHHIKANGKIASIMVEDNIFSLMAHPIKVNGKTI